MFSQLQALKTFDYQKHAITALNQMITIAAFIAAVATVIFQKWQEHNMNERCVNLLSHTQGFIISFTPKVIEAFQELYQLAVEVCVSLVVVYEYCLKVYNKLINDVLISLAADSGYYEKTEEWDKSDNVIPLLKFVQKNYE